MCGKSVVNEGSIRFYEYSFASAPVLHNGQYVFLNLQDRVQAQPNSFEQRFLRHRAVNAVLPSPSDHRRLCTAFRDRVIEVKADQFGSAVDNAAVDHYHPERAALIMQAFLNE